MRATAFFGFGVSVAALCAGTAGFAQQVGVVSDGAIAGRPAGIIGTAFMDLSPDGQGVAATVRLDTYTWRAYRVTAAGFEALPGRPGDASVEAWGIADDGTVVGGSRPDYAARGVAVIWHGTTLTELGHLATNTALQNSIAYGISGDGRVAVGASIPDSYGLHAVRWVDGGPAEDLNGGGFVASQARRASRDGSVIVGSGSTATRATEAFVWHAGQGMQALGVLPRHEGMQYSASLATDVSADGRVVVGVSSDVTGNGEAFRWTEAGGLQGLGRLPDGNDSRALATNGDGSVIVGSARRPSQWVPTLQDTVAMRWTEADGMGTVADWLGASGVAVGEDSFTDAVAISDAGDVVIGTGQINGTTQQYIARVTPGDGGGDTGGGDGGDGGGDTGGGDGGGDGGGSGGGDTGGGGGGGTGVIGLDEYRATLAGAGVATDGVIGAAGMTLFGAHHRPLTDFPQASKTCSWVTGDLGAGKDNRRIYSAEAGLCADLGPSVRAGIGAGVDRTETDLALGGTSAATGRHLVAELDFRPAGTPFTYSLTGYRADWELDLDRAYRNGGGIDHSRGKTSADVRALRLRADWAEMLRFGEGQSFSPWIAFTTGTAHVRGYTETGGAFPMQVAARDSDFDEARLGGRFGFRVNETARAQLTGEWVHRFNGAPPAMTGTILGIGAVSAAVPAPARDWGRIGVDLDVTLAPSTLLSFSGSTMIGNGSDAQLAGSVSLRVEF